MSDTRGLLDRISAFRHRLESKSPAATEPPESPAPAAAAEAEAFRQTLRQITGSANVAEGPLPPQLTDRARQVLQTAKELLDRQRIFTADPVFAGLSSTESDPLVAYHRETIAVIDSAVRMTQVLPDSPSVQLKLCDGLDGILEIVKERLTVQERALGQRRADLARIDRLAAVYAAMSQMRAVNLKPVVALAEEILEDARQTRPLRFLTADPLSTRSYPGGVELLAPARFLAAHALNVAQVVARVVHLDYEWASRPLVPVLGALLMDCGMMRVPAEVLARSGPLTPDERRLVESHPQYGAEWVVRYVADAAALADAIATHHERADGTGYPVGLKGSTIPALGRLLAAADVYAGMCADRPYRPGQDTRASLTDVLLLAEHGQLDRDFAEYLVHLSFYPLGSVVELTDGRVGVVAANHPNRMDPRSPGRPVVAVLAEADGTLLPRPEHVDLSASARGGILRTLPADRRRKVLGQRYPDLV
ncbi:MAG TPA: HD domain-containing phosphohydrolase [Gemmataceae bacterium]|nr:HD domain-containing phosphohydrolase [Gemmataceae bacterium]